MSENFITAQERRAFTRLELIAPVEVHQHGVKWELELINLSLTGLAVTEPDSWDADTSEPFYFKVAVGPGHQLEFHAHLVHIDPGLIGFEMGRLAAEHLDPLAKLLAGRLDAVVIENELNLLKSL
jgi:hypothetical protein